MPKSPPAVAPSPSSSPSPSPSPSSADVSEIERALSRVAYLSSKVRPHDRLMTQAGVSLDRAAVALLRQIADTEPLRPGELANRLAVEASHVTRQVQRLEKSGYVTRVPDPEDGRAQRIQLTPVGQRAIDRIREASRRGMQAALAEWSPQDLQQLAALFHRMVDDFLGYDDSDAGIHPERPA
ncbi:MarR family winged helix-turn-helix transcriptional regulator [Streptomyces sp. NPDC060131]|uniref:MarR family winged helix-turn-helix transcriptional regulator n=1 Tax=unclassified Streptomyces TaxID=2593676 RepID=UPI003661B66C